MVISISSDITLRGEKWVEVIDKFSTVLTSRPIYNVFLLSTAIGILHDKQKDNVANKDEILYKTLGRDIFNRYSEPFSRLLKASVLTTKYLSDKSQDDRLRLAFGEDEDFKIVDFLSSFANYGIEQLYELLNDDPIVLMENLKNYMLDSYHNPGIIDQETLAALEYYTTD